MIALVGLLASASAAAAPWYAVAATQQVGVAAVDGASAGERLITTVWRVRPDEAVPDDPVTQVKQQFSPPGFTSVGGAFVAGQLSHGQQEQSQGQDPAERPAKATTEPAIDVNIAYRESLCDHLVVTGSCPAAANEVVLGKAVADEFEVAVDDELVVTSENKLSTVRVVGLYQVIDPEDPYWGDGSLFGQGPDNGSERATAFTTLETLLGHREVGPAEYTNDLVAEPAAFATLDLNELTAALDAGFTGLRLRQGYWATSTGLPALVDRIVQDRQRVVAGVGVGVAVLLLVSWFTLIVVVRAAMVGVRGDVGWWRLHGAPSGRGWVSVLGQGVVPMVGGAAIGTAAGFALGQVLVTQVRLGGTIEGGGDRTAVLLALALVVVTVAGGLVAMVAAQLGTLRTPVRDLLRRTPTRHRRWRRSALDLILVLLAAVAVGQALTATADTRGLALLAPWLAVLAIALIAAWAVLPLVAWVAAGALHAGRLALALVAASMARRPGTHRIFALVAVAAGLLTTAFVGWDTADRTHAQRAALESGAERVVTVAAEDSAQLLAGVRAADPSGAEAMAVVSRPGIGTAPAVLAVDSTRLGVVAGWRGGYGGSVAEVAAALRPIQPEPVLVETGELLVQAAGLDPTGSSMNLRVRLRATDTGEPVDAVVGPLTGDRETYPAEVPACASGCRLVGVQLLGPAAPASSEKEVNGYEPPSAGARIELSGMADSAGTAIEPDLFREPARWRTALSSRDLGPIIATGAEGVRLTVAEPGVSLDRDDWAFVVDTPVPLPVVVAGWTPDPSGEARLAPLAGAAVPVEVARTASLVPGAGEVGIVADLTYAERLVPFSLGVGTPQVWLSATAPPSIMTDLGEAGLTPLREESLVDRVDRLNSEGSPTGVRFQAVVASVGLLLAAGALLVSTALERPGRTAELAALRTQGVSRRTIRAVGYGGLATVIGIAAVVGVAAGVIGALIARVGDPGFVDGWAVLPAASLHPCAVGLAAAATAGLFGVVVLVAGAALTRRSAP